MGKMEIYQKAYEYYRTVCQSYGMESLNFNLFVKHLTKEQLELYIKQAY
jgi:hypothetical protein